MNWTPSNIKPEGFERKVLLWIVWPECGRPSTPEAVVGWWRHGPETFSFERIENANHLVTHWAEITEPK